MDVAASLASALAALERDDGAGALVGLLELWRLHPAPPLADAIDDLAQRLPPVAPFQARTSRQLDTEWLARAAADDPRDLALLLGARMRRREEAMRQRFEALAARRRDPRVATWLHTLIEHQFTGDRWFWQQAFDALLTVGDPRSIAFLEQIERHLSDVSWSSLRAFVQPLRAALVTQLRERHPKVPALAPADAATLARIGAAVTELAARHPSRTREELLAAIYAAPADDGARLVYADWLQEQGDPQGRLLALQLGDPGDDPVRAQRARMLVFQHGRQWLGPLALVVSMNGMRYERGFPTVCTVNTASRDALQRAVGLPEWATVEELRFSGRYTTDAVCAALVRDPSMRSLRAVHGLGDEPAFLLCAADPPLPLTEIGIPAFQPAFPPREEFFECRGLPRLERLVLTGWHPNGNMDGLLVMRDAPVGRRVRVLAARSLNITLELHGPGDGTFPRLRLELRRMSRLDMSANRPLTMLDQCGDIFAALAGELRQVEVALPPECPEHVRARVEAVLALLPPHVARS